jgi:hypothetical protein
MIACLEKYFFLACEEDSAIHRIAKVWILSHLGWGRMYLLLSVHYPLVWDGVL